jgi:hypothetical protein
VSRGHDVTLFATADSVTSANLVVTSPRGWPEDESIDPKVAECAHIASLFERAEEFDVIHNGFDFLPLTYSGLVDTPFVRRDQRRRSTPAVALRGDRSPRDRHQVVCDRRGTW